MINNNVFFDPVYRYSASLWPSHAPSTTQATNRTLRATLAARYADQHALVSVEMHDRARDTRPITQNERSKFTSVLPDQYPPSPTSKSVHLPHSRCPNPWCTS